MRMLIDARKLDQNIKQIDQYKRWANLYKDQRPTKHQNHAPDTKHESKNNLLT